METSARELISVIQTLSRARTLDEITAIVRKAARSLVQSDGATFVLRDQDICFYADEDAISPLWKGKRFPMEACISGWSMIQKVPVVIEDIYQDSRIPHDAYRPTFVKSLTMVPIRAQDPIGAIGNYWSQSHKSDASEIALLQALADSTSVALENVQLYDSLQRRIQELDQANRTKDEFLMTVSHELRTPLNAVLGWAQLLQGTSADSEDWTLGLKTIERNARLQEHIINDLLDTARMTTGRLKIQSAPHDIAQLIRATADSFEAAVRAKCIDLRLVVNQPVGLVMGDAARIQQIVWNLLSNAVKFTREGGQITVRLEREGSEACIIVEDNGIGMAPDFLPHAFERFTQSDSTTTRKHGGLGLGLSIVKHLTEAHGGRVEAFSEGLNQGSRFHIYLPLAAISLSKPLREGQKEKTGALSGLKVLAIDDEADARILISTVLKRNGASVMTGSDASSGFRALADFKPDVLISDISMPGEDGYSLLRRIRKLGPEGGGQIPSIALTAFADKQHEDEAKEAGFDAFLAKPIHTEKVIEKILYLRSQGSS